MEWMNYLRLAHNFVAAQRLASFRGFLASRKKISAALRLLPKFGLAAIGYVLGVYTQ